MKMLSQIKHALACVPGKIALAALAVALPLGSAYAIPLSGSFTLNVYQGSGNNNINDPNNQADMANPLLGTTPLYSGTYNGAITLDAPSNNILAFLTSASGLLTGSTAALNTTLSTSNFGITTVFDFLWNGPAMNGSIVHDDGASLYMGGSPVALSAYPTVATTTNFASPVGGDYSLIYVSANNLPEVLKVDATAVPAPATLALLGIGLIGLGYLRSRRAS